MGNALFPLYRKALVGYGTSPGAGLGAAIDYANDTIKAALFSSAIGKTITGATNATPIVVTATSHGFNNGDIVAISGVAGNTAANGVFKIANKTTNTFELTTRYAAANVAGNGAYTSGGIAVNLTTNANFSDVSASQIGSSVTLASKTMVDGAAAAAAVTFSAVASGSTVYFLIIYKDTGTGSTSTLMYFDDTWTGAVDPLPTNGSDIIVTFSSGVFTI